ncbi:MAG: carbonate dehydratase [Gemmatimonadales bacterium]|nr:carbonate dehydratase [Gemmatimonadales bacterium]
MPLSHLLQKNRDWAERTRAQDPEFFSNLAGQQAPQFLWIGCSDSRVPANQIVGLPPGEVFVHRNVANLVVHSDLNCLSVIQYAVEVLRVKHIIVCGHYGCGGVRAALDQPGLGLIDNWLRHVEDVAARHHVELGRLPTDAARYDRLCELNAMSQALSVARTTFVRDAWAAGRPLSVHSWIYAVADGLLRDLKVTLTGQADLDTALEATTPIA